MAAPGRQGQDVKRPPRAAVTLVVEGLGILVQLFLVYVGLAYLFIADGLLAESVRLFLWSLIATVYLLGTALWLNIDLRIREKDPESFRRLFSRPVLRWFATIVTFSSSLVGLTAATTVILRPEVVDTDTQLAELVAVWAMLASWAMFHWGYARIYHSHYNQRLDERPLVFPGTDEPRLVDFVYFSFTNGTSFATSDVAVATSRMRWTVVWHTSFSFFFNALIIVLTMNTIVGGFSFL